MSVQHRYTCEINVPHTKEATRGQLLMQDNIHATFIAHNFISYKNKSWSIETVRKIFNVEISMIKVGLQFGIKYKSAFLLKSCRQYFEHAECIAIDIFGV